MIWIDSDGFDLLIRLKDAILATHEISKVAAHVDPRFTTDLPTCYQELGNTVANDSAIRACWSIHPWLVKECQKQCHQLQSSRVSLARWFEMLLEFQQHCAILADNLDTSTDVTTMARQTTTYLQFQTCAIEDPWAPPEMHLSGVVSSRGGKLISDAMLQWMGQVTWPQQDDADSFGVTWLELVLSFSMHIGYFFPVPKEVHNKQQFLIALPDLGTVPQYQVRFSDMANYFSIFFGQIDKVKLKSRFYYVVISKLTGNRPVNWSRTSHCVPIGPWRGCRVAYVGLGRIVLAKRKLPSNQRRSTNWTCATAIAFWIVGGSTFLILSYGGFISFVSLGSPNMGKLSDIAPVLAR